jgi:peptidoglycan/xylan/chitin deacetylase (PgdA/CDA1 family)
MVGISFDDGPNPENVIEILDILKEHKATATFFWIATYAKQLNKDHPTLMKRVVKRISKEGHEVGLHAPFDYIPNTWYRATTKFTKQQLSDAKKYLEDLTGQNIKYYRPHYYLQPISILYAIQLYMTTVLGNAAHYANPDIDTNIQIKKFSRANAGDILVFHDGNTIKRKTNYILKVIPAVLNNINKRKIIPTKVSGLSSETIQFPF